MSQGRLGRNQGSVLAVSGRHFSGHAAWWGSANSAHWADDVWTLHVSAGEDAPRTH